MQTSGLLARAARSISLLVLLQITGEMANFASAQTGEPEPYLLFTTQNSVRRMYPNGTSVQALVGPLSAQIKRIDYHYRLNFMFWIDTSRTSRPRIMRSTLNGSDVTVLLSGLSDPIDLAVDWLNNKLYWVDGTSKLIEEYDIISGNRRIVTSTGANSRPAALALYPYPNYGWLYWSDGTSQSIQRVSVTGDDRMFVRNGTACVSAISVVYSTHTLYWIDQCTYTIESLRLDGDTSARTIPLSTVVLFPSGLSVFNNRVYYSESRGIYSAGVDGGAGEVRLYRSGSVRSTGISIVHSSRQPSAEEYEEIITTVDNGVTYQCSGECANGKCIPPGVCACNSGWRGDLCDIDILECSEVNGGCEHSCEERNGGFQCTCFDGYVLTYDGRTCVDACRTTIVTITAVRPASATFDPCLTYIRETTSTSVYLTSTPTLAMSTTTTTTTSSLVSSSPSSHTSKHSSAKIAPIPTTSIVFSSSAAVEPTPVAVLPSTHPASPSSYIRPMQSTAPSAKPVPSSTSKTKAVEPTPVIVDIGNSQVETEGLLLGFGLYVLVGIGGGLALSIIFVIITAVIIIVLCVRYKRRRNRSWSPQKSFKSSGSTHIDSMVSVKPANGHSNGKVVPLSKAEEAGLDFDYKSSEGDLA